MSPLLPAASVRPAATTRYRLALRPGVSRLVPARAYVVPLSDAADHDRVRRLQPVQRTPVWLDHLDHVEFLADMANELWRALGPRTRVFLQVRSSFIGSLPPCLTDPRVLLGTYLTDKMHAWSERSRLPAVSIVDAIRRNLDDPGDNTLTCHASGVDRGAALDAALRRCGAAQGVELQPLASSTPTERVVRGAGGGQA